MRASLSLILLPLALGEKLVIPQVERLVSSQLELFANYTEYDGPTGTAAAALAKSTSSAQSIITPAPIPSASALIATREAERGQAQLEKRQAPAYWYEQIAHQGKAAFNSDSSYQIYRNVKSYGAKGDGVADDTAAIQAAMSAGNRCAPGSCASSTNKAAVIYFPSGTYVLSSSIVMYYQTIMLGNPNSLPILKAKPTFTGFGLIDGDQYQSSGAQGFGSTNIFWRQVRNFVIDMTQIPASSASTGIHWPTAQATSLQNIVFRMSSAKGTQHQGVFIEDGSGGWLGDLVFTGGLKAMVFGNQQFTFRNLTCTSSVTCVYANWDWSFTFAGLNVVNCTTAVDVTNGGSSGQTVGSITVFDSTIRDTQVFLNTSHSSSSSPPTGGSVVIENVVLTNVQTAVKYGDTGATYLAGAPLLTTTVNAWGAGHRYSPTGPINAQGSFTPPMRPASLLSGNRYYTRSKPQYNTLSASSFLSVRSQGAKGDGTTDDTAAVQKAITSAQQLGRVTYFDAGTYKITKTLFVPAGSRIVGEAYAVIMSSGSYFSDVYTPQPVIQVGRPGDSGVVEWSDMIVSTQGSQSGAILIQWNLASSTSNPSGVWDVHARVGGFIGSNLQKANCPTSQPYSNKACWAANMLVHITKFASGLYLENNWLWTADHDVDDPTLTQISVYTGRGVLIESATGSIWLWGTGSEHNQRYQFNLVNTKNIFLGLVQTETPYYQPNPKASLPFPKNLTISDPDFDYYCPEGKSAANCPLAFGLRIQASSSIAAYGVGLYSFFSNYALACSALNAATKCQQNILQYDSAGSKGVNVYNLNTVGSSSMATRDLTSLARWQDNVNNYASTIFYFSSG